MAKKGTRYTINLIVEAVHDGGKDPDDWDVVAEAVRNAIKGQTVRSPGGGFFELRAVVIDEARLDEDEE